ncbi:hypothetical protein HYX03_00065 [Candidatus Woesearchaeota archaeon]|nr:hypothetical protein [Candidatus Woesearchaeota archaeon]
MEKVNPNVVALSLGITASILYVICLIAVAILPIQTMVPLVNNLIHSVDFTGMMTKNISFAGSIIGVLAWFLIAMATGYIYAFVYNWVGEKF